MGPQGFVLSIRRACIGAVVLSGAIVAAQKPESRAPAGNVSSVTNVTNITGGCVEAFDPTADYFPDKATIDDAINFSVEYRKSYKVVTMKAAETGGPPERYVLVQCGAPVPTLAGDLAGAQAVTVPIDSFFAFSTTNLSLLVDLGRLDVLTGVAQFDPIASPEVQARIRTGKVVEFARVGLVMDVERIVTARPALLMAGGSSSATLAVIRNAGVPVVANDEWLEPTALGRAEWLKYMALFLNEERKAQMLYGRMKDRYRSISKRVAAIPEAERPLVMAGQSTRGVFTIAGGRSYVASMIKDAGGRYAWADNTAAGIASVDLEAQIRRAANADVWINGLGWKSLTAMRDDEPRYAEFKAYRQGQVWTYDRAVTPGGGNDYWSRSVTHPDLVLSDLVKIFHPQLASDHAFEWYSKLPTQ